MMMMMMMMMMMLTKKLVVYMKLRGRSFKHRGCHAVDGALHLWCRHANHSGESVVC